MQKNKKGPLSHWKNQMFVFGLHSTSDDQPGSQWTQTLSAIPLQPKKSNVHFWITFNFCWSAEQSKQKSLTEMQKNEKGPLSHQKLKCSFLDYVQLLMIGQVIWAKNVDWNAKKKKQKRPPKSLKNQSVHFWITFNFWWLAKQSEQKTSTKMEKKEKGPLSHWKIKCSFLDYVQLLMIGRAIRVENVNWNDLSKKSKVRPNQQQSKQNILKKQKNEKSP